MTNLTLFLNESADMYPGARALGCDGATMTYSALADDVARFAAYLIDEGLKPGDRVGIMLPNAPAFAVVFYGVLHAGGVVVPINPSHTGGQVEFVVTDTGAKALFFATQSAVAATSGALAAWIPPVAVDEHQIAALTTGLVGRASPVSRAADDTAVILHTSSTTGVPKSVELTHGNLLSNQAVTARGLLNLGPDDVVMGCLPLWEGFGMICGLAAAVSVGATLVLLPTFDPWRALKVMAAERVTVFEGDPTMYAAMLGVADGCDLDFSSLRVCMSAGALLPAELLSRFEDRFGCTVLEGYGLAETSPAVCFNRVDAVRKAGSIGMPIDGIRMRVVDDRGCEVPVGIAGEIQVRGPNVMKGYWNQPEATDAAMVEGWLSTGAIGRVDEDGYFFLAEP